MAVNILGVVSVAAFYVLVLAIGVWGGWKHKRNAENLMLAGRNMGLFVGVLTMTATWVAGGYINGTAEAAFTGGIWKCTQVPIGYTLSLLLGGLLFAKPMRDRGYVTMLDPFQEKYGPRVGGILFVPSLCGEIFWTASVLAALGTTLSVMLDVDVTLAVIISAAVAVVYTLFGGLYSVAYTDVIQLFCIFFGLVFCVPFVTTHQALDYSVLSDRNSWIDTIEPVAIGSYIDIYLLVTLGGIPWQVYFQRVLSCKTSKQAQLLSYIAAVGCLLLAIPPITLGMLGKAADWENKTTYGMNITTPAQFKMILPLVMQYLTPEWVSFIGLGAVSAAVMSSADSAVLSSGSMFARNIYQAIFVPTASEKHVIRVTWVGVVCFAGLAAAMAVNVRSIFALSYLCSDLVYVVLFPQLLLLIHWEQYCHKYGSLAAFIVAFTLRVLSGEELLYLPAVIQFPWYQDGQQNFPFRTTIMMISLLTQVTVSHFTLWVFGESVEASRWDVLRFGTTTKDQSPDEVKGIKMATEEVSEEEVALYAQTN